MLMREKVLGPLLGRGNTADVYDVGNNRVVKLFNAGYPLQSVRYEIKNSKLLNALDIPIIKSYELATYGGRHGIVYDKLDGVSMLDLIFKTGDLEQYAAALAVLHKKILSQKLQRAVNLKSILKTNIKRSDSLSKLSKTEFLKTLDGLPDGYCFCHGDFHFGNVIANQGTYYVIDYMNVCRGHKFGDIARTVYLLEMTPVPPDTNDAERLLSMKKHATDIYLSEMGVSRESLAEWLMVIAAARLSELRDEETAEKNAVFKYLLSCGLNL
jgi:hypothetical protein